MNPTEQAAREREIFVQALEKPSLPERQAYLQATCAGDAKLLARVERLLLAHDAATEFLPDVPALPGALPAGPPPARPGERIGRYKLLQQIGEGGCGVVYMAEQEEPVRRRVALKVIKLGMDTQSVVARFEAERQALAMMDHPNIAKVFDAGATEQGRPFFVMELVRGVPLTRFCDERNLSTRERLDLFVHVCQAVQHAHQKGIIHRDLKPSNVLVTLHDDQPVPKVIDFGIAKATEGRLTDRTLFTYFEQFIGTPAYMSPEQAGMSGLDIDTRSDIYSLGVLLYELLAGQPPFDPTEMAQAGVDEIRRRIREVDPPRPSIRFGTLTDAARTTTAEHRRIDAPRLTHLLAGDLDWIVMKCLEKDRTRRYDTANGLAADIQRHLLSEPVLARPPSTVYRLRKAMGRNRLAFAAGTAITASLLVGLAVSSWLYLQQRQALRQEAIARTAAQQERTRADAEASVSRQARTVAEEQTKSAEKSLARLNVAEGWRRVEEGDYFGALLPFAEALKLEENDPERAALHRMRLASVLQHCPKLVNVWSSGSNLTWAAFTRDGSRLVTAHTLATNRAVARVWDPATGTPLTPPMEHAGMIYSVQWSRDEAKLVTASADQTARVWDSRSGAPLGIPLVHTNHVTFASFDSKARRVVTTTANPSSDSDLNGDLNPGVVCVWDVSSGLQQLTLDCFRYSRYEPAIFTPDDRQFTTWGQAFLTEEPFALDSQQADNKRPDTNPNAPAKENFPGLEKNSIKGEFGPWSVSEAMADSMSVGFSPDGSRLFTIMRGGPGELLSTPDFDLVSKWTEESALLLGRFGPMGSELATVNRGSVIRLWDSATGNPISAPLFAQAPISSIAFNQDARRMAFATKDGFVRVWEPKTGLLRSPRLPTASTPLQVAFSTAGTEVFAVGSDGTVTVWDLRTDAIAQTLWNDPKWSYLGASVSGNSLAAFFRPKEDFWADDNSIRIWDLQSAAMMVPAIRGPYIDRAAITHDGFNFVSEAVNGNSIQIVDLREGKRRNFQTRPEGELTNWVSLSQNKNSAFVWPSDTNNPARIFDLATGHETSRLPINLPYDQIVLSPDGRRMLLRFQAEPLSVWQRDPAKLLFQLGATNAEHVRTLNYSSDGTRIIRETTREIQVWDGNTGASILGPVEIDEEFSISADLRWMAIWNSDGFKFLNLSDGRLSPRISLRQRTIQGAEFSPRGNLLATLTADHEIRIWDVPTGEPVTLPFRCDSPLSSVSFSPHGDQIIAGSPDGAVIVMNLPSVTNRSPEDWLSFGRFGAGDTASSDMSTNGITVENWWAMRRRHPGDFTVPAQSILAWDRNEIWRAELRRDWATAVDLLTRQLETLPGRLELFERRANAYANWADAVEDAQPRSVERICDAQRNQVREFRERALADLNQAFLWVERFPDLKKEGRRPLLERRGSLLWKLGKNSEAGLDFAELWNTPVRPTNASRDLVDLSPWYNVELGAIAPARILKTPIGTDFDLRSSVLIRGDLNFGNRRPVMTAVRDIDINRSARKLHFLIGGMFIAEPIGSTIARVVIHLANGSEHSFPIKHGEDVWENRVPAEGRQPPKNAIVAWTGPGIPDQPERGQVEIFERVWDNPNPESQIEKIDIISTMNSAALRLYAITVTP